MGQGKAKDSITNVPWVHGTAMVGWLLRAPLPLPKFTMTIFFNLTQRQDNRIFCEEEILHI